MLNKLSIIYSWFIRTILFFFPNIPFFMRVRGFLYSLMMKKCGKNFQVTSSATLVSLIGIEVGDNVYIASNSVIISIDLNIGDNVIIGPNTVISGGNHVFDGESFRFLKSKSLRIIINKGCWIAANTTITGGAILPENSILAAGAVLNKKLAKTNSIYGGIPAKFIKIIEDNSKL